MGTSHCGHLLPILFLSFLYTMCFCCFTDSYLVSLNFSGSLRRSSSNGCFPGERDKTKEVALHEQPFSFLLLQKFILQNRPLNKHKTFFRTRHVSNRQDSHNCIDIFPQTRDKYLTMCPRLFGPCHCPTCHP